MTSNELVSRWLQIDAYGSIARSDVEQHETRLTRKATPLAAGGTLIKMCSGVGARVSRGMLNKNPQSRTDLIFN